MNAMDDQAVAQRGFQGFGVNPDGLRVGGDCVDRGLETVEGNDVGNAIGENPGKFHRFVAMRNEHRAGDARVQSPDRTTPCRNQPMRR